MARQDRDITKVIRWLAGVIATVVAVGLPSVYFAIACKSTASALRAEAEMYSRAMTDIVNANPDMWMFESVRIMGLLEHRLEGTSGDSRRVMDMEGNPIAATNGPVAPPALVRSCPIRDSGRPVGTVEIRRSLRPMLWNTALFALLGGIVGIAVFFVLKILPMAALKRALHQLTQEKERAQVTLQSIADGVITTDTVGNVEIMNRPAEGMTGWRQEEAAGRPIREVFRVLDGHTERELENPLEERKADSRAGEQNVLVARDGTRRLIDESVAPIPGGGRGSAGAILVFRDVTEKVRKEEEIVKWQKLESLGSLAGGIAHEFNNVLTAILGNVSLAKQTLAPGGKAHGRLAAAEEACAHASGLTAKLLTFSKGGNPVRELIRPERVVRDSARTAINGSKARCEFGFAGDLWTARADAGQIGQAVSNLVNNAVQAMPEGGRIRIRGSNVTVGPGEITYVKPGPYVKIEVIDSGVGIPRENLKRIFNPYFTTRADGGGLGLTTSYHILKSHGGNLFVDSEPGAGTTATLFLPASMERLPDGAEAEKDTLPDGKRKVLVMDDEELVRDMAMAMLEHLGCEAQGARDGSEAIRMYDAAAGDGRPFGMVIMDLTIPGGMGGKEAAARLLAGHPGARLVVCSGYSSDPVMADFQAYGFMGMLGKPFKMEEFRRVIQHIMAVPPARAAGDGSG